jgi:hypothetical protein
MMAINVLHKPAGGLEGIKYMLLAICAVLIIMWMLGLTAFHVAGGFIHLLLIFAVISLVIHSSADEPFD